MARRMFSTEIANSDHFLDMPSSTQVLYFHLGLHCDDDGFVYPKKVMRMIGASDDDLKILISKKFVLAFQSGVLVVKHWNVNNYIRSDRHRATPHREELAQLSLDKGGVYHLSTNRLPDGGISKEVSKEVIKEISFKENAEEANLAISGKLAEVSKRLRSKKII